MRFVFLVGALIACGDDSSSNECVTTADCVVGVCVDSECVPATDSGPIDSSTPDTSLPDTSLPDTRPDDAPMCMATETPEATCNGLDDDCNGLIDDIDVGGDGICDCLNIGVLGSPGPLASSSFQAWLEGRGTSVARFGEDGSTLSTDVLVPFDVVILDRLPREYTAEEAGVLLAFVEGGGGVIAMTGHDGSADLPRANTLLAPFEVAYVPGLITEPVEDWTAHPISMGISSVTFRGGYAISSSDTDIARIGGMPVGVVLERGDGRAFIWGDEWIEYDSEWTTMPMIQQLWANMLGWVGPRDRCDVLLI